MNRYEQIGNPPRRARKRLGVLLGISLVAAVTFVAAPTAGAATMCSFSTSGTTMTLDGDCTTEATIEIPDGFTLNGANHTITAVDPSGGHFTGAVIANQGGTAHVTNVTVTASGLADFCDAGPDRLRGIMFDGASGSITHSSVIGLNKGASGCQEGNAIEIRNAPFDGTHPNTLTVEIAHNYVDDYQKTGILANGDVDVSIHHNLVGDSATQQNLAANSVQLGFGAAGSATSNRIEGNQWLGMTNYAATAVLVYLADDVTLSKNHIAGNSDVGLYVYAEGGTYNKNKVFDEGTDDGSHGDVGIVDFGTSNTFNKNHVKGFENPFYPDPLDGEKNKALPGRP